MPHRYSTRRALIGAPGDATIESVLGIGDATNAGSAGRKLWSASSPTFYTATGTAVDTVTDQTGHNRTFAGSGASRPTIAQNIGPKSRPAFLFDGVDDQLVAGAISTFITNSAGWAAFSIQPVSFVHDDALSYRNDCIFEDGGAFAALTIRTAGIAYAYNWDGNEDKAASGSGAIVLGTPYVLEWRHDGGNIYLRINGAAEFSVASGNTSTITGTVQIGGVNPSTPTRYYNGYIYEWMFAATVPTLGARNAVVKQLGKYCGANV